MMKQRFFAGGLLVVALALTAAAEGRAPRFEKVLPLKTVAYLGVADAPGLVAKMRKQGSLGALDDPKMKAFLAPIIRE